MWTHSEVSCRDRVWQGIFALEAIPIFTCQWKSYSGEARKAQVDVKGGETVTLNSRKIGSVVRKED